MVLWYGSDGTKEEKAKILVSSPPGSQPREYQPVLFKGAGTFSPTYLRSSPDGQKILRPGSGGKTALSCGCCRFRMDRRRVSRHARFSAGRLPAQVCLR